MSKKKLKVCMSTTKKLENWKSGVLGQVVSSPVFQNPSSPRGGGQVAPSMGRDAGEGRALFAPGPGGLAVAPETA